jgi:hypothetical protein
LPQTKECLKPPEAGIGEEEFLPGGLGGSVARPTVILILDFWSLEVRMNRFLLL